MLGTWAGGLNLPLIILLSSFVALPIFVIRFYLKGTSMSTPLPYGPFLALGGWLSILYGAEIWAFIFHWRAVILNTILG